MPNIRDEVVRRQEQFDKKQDVLPVFRAVLCDAAGLTSGSGSVWADEDERLVWYRKIGTTQAAQVRCVRLEPQLGLGVLIGYAEGSNEQEVLSDDPFLRNSGLGGRAYLSPSGRDFEPGGRLQMWLYSKAFIPLATYPGTGLSVTVVKGDYEASDGTRKSFNGKINHSIAAHQPAGPNEHCLVGIYIDTANALQTVAGATVATSATAPEPSWPAGAVRLSVVDLDDTQTSINFADDITDRRLYFPYPGGGGVWPAPGEIKIGSTSYATLAAAIAAAVSGDTIKLGEGTYPATNIVMPDGVQIVGSGWGTILENTTGAAKIISSMTFETNAIRNLTLYNNTTNDNAVQMNNGLIENVRFINNALNNSWSIDAGGSSTPARVVNCQIDHALGVCIEAIDLLAVRGCYLNGSVALRAAGASAHIYVSSTKIANGTVEEDSGGTISGEWEVDYNSFNSVHRHAPPYDAAELASAPATPDTGRWRLYFKSGGLYHVDDAGAETGPLGTGGGGWPYSQVLTVDASDADADYSTVGAAITAASAGDVIEIGSDISETSVTLSKALTLRAVSPEITLTITSSTTGLNITASGARVENITVANTTTDTTTNAIYCNPASGSVTLENVTAVNSSGGTNRRAITVAAFTANLINCEATGTGGGGTDYGLLASGATVVANVRGGKYSGDSWDVYVGSGDAASLSGLPEFANGLVFVDPAGSMTGDYVYNGDLLNRIRVHQAVWFDYPLVDKANASGIASHLRDNTATYPTGWTQSTAPAETNTNGLYSFWRIGETSAAAGWKYQRQTSITLENINNTVNFQFGPVLFRDGGYSANIEYRFGMYADNAGAPNLNIFSRVLLQWTAGTGWQIRGEAKDGTTQTNSAFLTMATPLTQPLYFRVFVNDAANQPSRQYVGTSPVALTHTLFQTVNTNSTWGQVWLIIEQTTRGAGVTDYLYIGAVDYLEGEN